MTNSVNWEQAARIIAIFAGILFGSLSIGAAIFVWVKRQVFAYGGSALCVSGLVLLGLSIWHSVEFGVGTSGLNFKAAQGIVESAAKSADQAAKAADAAAKAQNDITNGPGRNNDVIRKMDEEKLAKAALDARKSADDAKLHLNEVSKSLGTVFGHRVCIPWC